MLLLLTAALLQGAAPSASAAQPPAARATSQADSTAVRRDGARDSTRRSTEHTWRRIPVTAEHLRTAFVDPGARELLQVARDARTRQDTALLAYDATTFQRISAGLGIRRFGRERLLFRQEIASRVRWRRGEGVVVDLVGKRQAVPAGKGRGGLNVEVDIGGDIGPIPYLPGQETFWIASDDVEDQVNDDDNPLVHPLAEGAEAYYRYQSGQSATLRLAAGREIHLRELRVRPREPRWNLAVGSLWFDTDNAQLVRAVYRLSVPMEVWQVVEEVEEADGDDDVPGWVKAMINPLRVTVGSITVEYGLEQGNFWLPRLRAMEGEAEAGFLRVPVRFEQSFRYASVNGRLDSLPALAARLAEIRAAEAADSAWRDTLRSLPPAQRDSAREAHRARGDARGVQMAVTVGGGAPSDSGRAAARRCAPDDSLERTMTRMHGRIPVLVRIPCDTLALAHSPALPPSIFAEDETPFDAEMEQALRDAALSLQAQAEWSPTPPQLKYGLGEGLLRYNRVEGLSPALAADVQLGRGYAARGLVRIGTADWQPNGELSLSRGDGRRTLRAGVYRRLAAANDWGDPLGLSASLSGLLFGRDEGFYYRKWGAEIGGDGRGGVGGGDFAWRLFSERHDAADVETRFALFQKLEEENIDAREGSVTGLGARYVRTFGLDPRGLRLLADLRGEGGVGSFTYGRALADLTLSHSLGARLDGALTLSGGSTVGEVPVQRWFYLGGPQSVRGQDGGTARGDAYWMARAELGTSAVGARPVLFYDMGWAGARDAWRHPGRPISGAGIGLSVLDGLMRFDVARGIWPQEQWRVDLYLEARF
ncbi:MAG TPA: ShlB/FhaC/HecB family hemolysin secretion/activation protein [Gemmatimonadaceae bacterium]|nr:ShlB/FhaC/HecB family hemolysin secretion/activation protein [Gemmatimonadaceae bacterium]